MYSKHLKTYQQTYKTVTDIHRPVSPKVLPLRYRLPHLRKDHLHRGLGDGRQAAGHVHGHGDRGPVHPRRHLPSADVFCDSKKKPVHLLHGDIPSLGHGTRNSVQVRPGDFCAWFQCVWLFRPYFDKYLRFPFSLHGHMVNTRCKLYFKWPHGKSLASRRVSVWDGLPVPDVLSMACMHSLHLRSSALPRSGPLGVIHERKTSTITMRFSLKVNSNLNNFLLSLWRETPESLRLRPSVLLNNLT